MLRAMPKGRAVSFVPSQSTKRKTGSIQIGKMANETNNQILALKAKHEEEKDRFELDLKKLQEVLKEQD